MQVSCKLDPPPPSPSSAALPVAGVCKHTGVCCKPRMQAFGVIFINFVRMGDFQRAMTMHASGKGSCS